MSSIGEQADYVSESGTEAAQRKEARATMLRNGTYKTEDGRTVTVKQTATGYLITDVATGEVTVVGR